MIIKVNDSSLCLHYLDGFRFQVGGNEYCVLLDTTDIDLYQYEIWKKDGNNLTFVNNVHVSLDKFREYCINILIWYNSIILQMKDQQIIK